MPEKTDFEYALGMMMGAFMRERGLPARPSTERQEAREIATPWLRDGRD